MGKYYDEMIDDVLIYIIIEEYFDIQRQTRK